MTDISLEATVRAALDRGSRTQFSFDHQPFDLADLWAEATALADALSDVLQPGDRLLVMARNGRAALLAWWAAHLCHAIVTPLNVANRSTILEHQVRDSDPVAALVEQEFARILSDALDANGQRLRRIVVADAAPDTWPGAGDVVTLTESIRAGSSTFSRKGARGEHPSHLIYTAGTTGPSKACMVGDGYVDNMARQMVRSVGKRPGETLWTALPLFHLAAVTHAFGAITIDGSVSFATRFSVSRFWEDVHRSGARTVALMGSMLPLIAAAAEDEFTTKCHGQVRVVTGSPVPEELSQTWKSRFGVERVGSGTYGLTEAALVTHSMPDDYREGTAGKVNDSFEVRIVDEHDHPVPTGEVGEIVCRPNRPGIMFQGYWRDPAKTLETFRNLWFHTGDYGRLDDDGHLWFVDRSGDHLQRGGENISSYEIEQVFAQHPAIREVAVHALPSDLSEDEVKVTAVLREDSTLEPSALFDWCQERLPRYALPTFIEFRADLPRNPVGRVLKYRLREEGVTPETWQRPLPHSTNSTPKTIN